MAYAADSVDLVHLPQRISESDRAAAARAYATAARTYAAAREAGLWPPLLPSSARSRSSLPMITAAVSMWFVTMWLLTAAVAVMAVARAACGVRRCPAVTEAMALVALTEFSLAIVSSVAMLLLSYCTEAPIREAVGGAVVLWELVSAPFVLLGLGAFLLVMNPPLEGWSRLERIGSAIHGAGTLGMAAMCCFVVIPKSLLTMSRRVREFFD